MESRLGTGGAIAEGLTVRTGVSLRRDLISCIHGNLRDSLGGVWVVEAIVCLSESLSVVPEDSMFEVSKGDEDRGDVVERSPQQTVFNKVIYAETRQLVHSLRIWVESLEISGRIPDHTDGLSVVDAVENTVASQQDEVVVGLNPESLDLGCCDQNLWISAELWQLCLNIAESPTDRESSRKDSQRAVDYLLGLSVATLCLLSVRRQLIFSR